MLTRRRTAGLLACSLSCRARTSFAAIAANVTIKEGDLLKRIDDSGKTFLTSDDVLHEHGPVLCWPVSPDGKHVRKETSYNRLWVMKSGIYGMNGFIAYSAICQHAACLVSDWDSRQRHLICPCHGSAYSVDQGGRVVAGPAPYSLPYLPLGVRQNALIIAGVFSGQIGGHASRAD